MATDRVMIQDVCYKPKQRPDVLLDMEQILSRKCDAVAGNGVPYSQGVICLIAIHIFHKLVACNLYNSQGQRKEQHVVLEEELINSVEHAKLLNQYMASSCKKTEYHKSTSAQRNVDGTTRYNCNQCPRSFNTDINLTLHVYWHTCLHAKEKAIKKGVYTGDLEAEDHSDEVDTNPDLEFRFSASPGWLKNFQDRCNVAYLKMKGKKGSADYEAVDK